jgi:tol-pal system protein YbgF
VNTLQLRHPVVRLLAGLLGAAGVVACVTTSEFRALQRDVEGMRESGGASGSAPAGGEARLAELGAQIDALEQEMARLRGAVEEAQHEAEEARRVAEAARRGGAQGGEEPLPMVPPGAGAQLNPGVTSLSHEVRDYEEAFALYRAGRFGDAIDRFRTFLQNYPSSGYADNALFWVGECQFRTGDFERAVLTFEDVVNRYPDENKVPDALYRQGVALLEIGRKKGEEEIYTPAAREIFERIVSEYPASTRVPEAKKQLEKLGP